jgi:serine/threonine protein phosphatase PrpC
MPQWMVQSKQLSDVGRKREHNEDYVGFFEPGELADLETHGRLYVLADGVGGAAAGEVASQYVVEKVIHTYFDDTDDNLSGRLRRAIEQANADVFAENRAREEKQEMATTVVAAVIRGSDLIVVNVGDSRAYLIREDSIEQITQDHSLVAEMVSDGSITAEQAETHPYRNVVLRSIGAVETVQVDVFSRDVVPDDILVLCSDGVTRHVNDEELADIAAAFPPDVAARRLVELANERGGEDNITISITRIEDEVVQGKIAEGGQLPKKPRFKNPQ